MNKKPIFSWQEDDGIAVCKITNPENDYIAVGMARCHPEDRDMMSEKTGLEIAYHRALMNLYKNKVKNLKKERRVHEDIYKTFMSMPNFDKENRYIRVVRHRIYGLKEEIKIYQELINNTRAYINDFIDNKTKFYNLTRANRKVEEFKQEG